MHPYNYDINRWPQSQQYCIYTIHHTSLQLTPASYSSTARPSPRTVRPDVPWLISGSVNGIVITATVRVSYSLGYISIFVLKKIFQHKISNCFIISVSLTLNFFMEEAKHSLLRSMQKWI